MITIAVEKMVFMYGWRPSWPLINTLKQRQDSRRFPDDIFKHILLNENGCILMKISLKFVPQGPINNISALA